MARMSLIKNFQCLEIEEKILNLGALIAALGVFMPWFGGEWFGEPTVWSGFQFYTSFIGLLIFLANVFILSLTVLPMMGYQVVRASLRDHVRFIAGLECVFLVIVAWSVLTNITFDRARQMEIRFGIYLVLVGGIIVSLYAFLRIQQQKKRNAQDFFQHPDDTPPPPRRSVEAQSSAPRSGPAVRGSEEPSGSRREGPSPLDGACAEPQRSARGDPELVEGSVSRMALSSKPPPPPAPDSPEEPRLFS